MLKEACQEKRGGICKKKAVERERERESRERERERDREREAQTFGPCMRRTRQLAPARNKPLLHPNPTTDIKSCSEEDACST
jgi:hypothetical protein